MNWLTEAIRKMGHSGRSERLRFVVEVISDKWRLTVLHHLFGGPLRTSQLQRNLESVSAKMLIQTLRGLERDGLIHRDVTPGVPPRVEYRLTEIGSHLLTALDGLFFWSESYSHETLRARRDYDARV